MPLDSHQSSDQRVADALPAASTGWLGLGAPFARAAADLRSRRTRLRGTAAHAYAAAPPVVRRTVRRVEVVVRQLEQQIRPRIRPPSQWYTFTGSLSRRIFTANFFGLFILLAGFGMLTYQHTWLIDAKAESLRTEARMIAVAVASNAKVETETLVIDPDHAGEYDRDHPGWHDEALQPITLQISPERVAPIVKKLIQSDNIRVRLYTRANVKLVDTDGLAAANAKQSETLPHGLVSEDGSGPAEPAEREKLRNSWTRFTAWMMRSPLQVYREIGSATVTDYPEVQAALAGQVTSVLLLNDKGEQIISVFAPVQRLNSIPAFVWLTTRPGDLDNILWRERRPFFGFSLLALLATLAASIMLRRTIGGPMRQLATAAEHVSRNINARQEIPDLPGRRDEIGEMASAYRKMTAALYRRIEASDRFAQDVAHELKNPVAAAQGTAQAMAYAQTDAERMEKTRQIQGEMKRLSKLISDVSNVSRLDADLARQETEPVDVAVVATNITGVFRDIQAGRDDEPCIITLRIEPPQAAPGTFVIDGHEGRLGQVLTNLVDNALSFSPSGGSVTVSVVAEPDVVVVCIEDEGPGIPPNKLNDVFNRFYSDRPQSDRTSGKNSGLGLSISREIVEAHGGTVVAENRPATADCTSRRHDRPELASRRNPAVAGARFEVRLPRTLHGRPGRQNGRLGFMHAK